MAVVVFLGGILNLARIAYPSALAIVVGIGILLSLIGFRVPPARFLLAVPVLIFTIATQLPPSVYNLYDDYQKYFAYPVRMLETGTVFGSPSQRNGSANPWCASLSRRIRGGVFPDSIPQRSRCRVSGCSCA